MIEEEVVYTCPACPGMGAQTCKFPTVIYSLGAKIDHTSLDGVFFADLDGVTWIHEYNDADTPTVTYESVVVRYSDSSFYRNGVTADPEVNATDIYTGSDVEYSLNRPGFFMAFTASETVTSTILREGDKYYVPFLGYWVEVSSITLTGAQLIIRDADLEIVTLLNLEYTAQPDGKVNQLFIYLNDMGGNRLSSPARWGGQPVPMIFFLHVYRVDADHDYMEVLLSSPWIDTQAFERIDLDGDGYVDVTDLEESWPSDADTSSFDWWIQYTSDGPYFVGYVWLDGVRRGPFAVKAEIWEGFGRIYGVTSYTWAYGDPVTVHDPVWYVVTENGTWPVGEERTYGGISFALTSIEVQTSDSGLTCCGANCTTWSMFGLYKFEPAFCFHHDCELDDEVGFLHISSTYAPRTLDTWHWLTGTQVPIRYCGCTYRSPVAAQPPTTQPPSPPPPPFNYILSPSPADMEAALALSQAYGASIVATPPEEGSYVILGGPFAHDLGAEAASRGRIFFTRAPGGVIRMRVASIDTTWEVNGSDWSRKDYAVVFSYLEEGGDRVFAVMGCTRYGTRAGALWLTEHVSRVIGGYGSVLEWVDYDGDGEVEAREIRQIARFPVGG